MDAGLITNLEQSVTGAVFTDFLLLARQAMAEKSEGAKNVAAVLAGALFEDTIRRIAAQNGLPHTDKLQDVLTELKTGGFMQGTQVGIANGYQVFETTPYTRTGIKSNGNQLPACSDLSKNFFRSPSARPLFIEISTVRYARVTTGAR
jgi:hypothetical protein